MLVVATGLIRRFPGDRCTTGWIIRWGGGGGGTLGVFFSLRVFTVEFSLLFFDTLVFEDSSFLTEEHLFLFALCLSGLGAPPTRRSTLFDPTVVL